MMFSRGWRVGLGRYWSKGQSFIYVRWIRDRIYSMKTIVHNIVYLKFAERVDVSVLTLIKNGNYGGDGYVD